MIDDPLILLFIKDPAMGRVKSRLAAKLGEDMTRELYRNFVLDTLASVEACAIPFRICYDPPGAGDSVKQWLGDRLAYLPQEGADIGQRMEHAFRQAFGAGCRAVILIGSDIPDLPPAMITDAFRALGKHDAVIGPALDGGYYLIGFNNDTFFPRIFSGIEWSKNDVFSRTMQTFDQAGRRVYRLPLWRDVDTVEDLIDLAARGRHSVFSSSRTMSFLSGTRNELFSSEASDAKIRL